MRSQTDLAAAFALIEAAVDEYSEHAPEPTQVVDLVPDRPRPTPRRRTSARRMLPVIGGAALAASIAALLVAVGGLGSSGPHHGAAGGAGPAALGADGRSVPFTISPSTGLQLISVVNSATGRTAELAGQSAHLTAWVGEPDEHTHISPGLEPVNIGDQHGYYDDGSVPALEPTSTAPTSTASSAPTATSTETPGSVAQPAVVWEYAPTAFAVVTGFDPESPPDKAMLLQAARGIRITSSAPLALSFRLARAPFGGELTTITATTRLTETSKPPYSFTSDATLCEASYSVPATGNGVAVMIERAVLTEADHGGGVGSGVKVVVDGHDARWDVRFHQLVVDLGDHVYARIVEQNFTGRYTLSLHQFEDVFGLVTLAPDVADPATWISVQQGLP